MGAQPGWLWQSPPGQQQVQKPALPPFDLHERARQALRIASESRGVEISVVFAGAGQPELGQNGELRGEDEEQDYERPTTPRGHAVFLSPCSSPVLFPEPA